jgi:hypothetical protein
MNMDAKSTAGSSRKSQGGEAKNWDDLSPFEKLNVAHERAAKEPPDDREHFGYRVVGPYRASDKQRADQGSGAAGNTSSSQLTKPEGLEERYWDPRQSVKWADLNSDVANLRSWRTSEEECHAQRQDIGKQPTDYTLDLGDFEPPEGVELTLSEQSPIVAPARSWAMKHQVTKAAFGELLQLYVKHRVEEVQSFNATVKAERKSSALLLKRASKR